MYPDHQGARLVHRQMIDETLQRHGPAHLRRSHGPIPGARPMTWLRPVLARAMHRLADHIDTAPRAGRVCTAELPTARG